MTAYDPSVHRTVVAANGESGRKFHSVNKLLIDMDAAGMIDVSAQDDPPSDTTVVWLDLTIPEDGNGQAKVYDGGSWVPLTPEYFVLHYGASTAAAAASALAAASSASAAEGFKNQTISDASATAADVLTADAAKLAALAAQSAAEQARDEAEIAADNFDDVYLGSKATDPTLDNDGDALVEGQLYWSSATNALKVYDGASWISYSAASGITDLVEDTSPQLGGNLDLNGHVITGLEIGTNVQAQSSNLDSWSMVVPSDYLTTTAAAAAYQPVNSTLTSLAGASANGVSLVTAADYAAMRVLLDLEAGTDFLSPSAIAAAYQAISARLTDIAGLAVTDGNIIVGDGTTWVAESGSTARASLGLEIGTHVQAYDAATLKWDVENQGPITGGANITPKDLGGGSPITTGTVTVDVGDRIMQSYTNGGAHTLAVDTGGTGSAIVMITNNGSAGAITTSAFDGVFGDPFTTTNGHKFRCVIERWSSSEEYLWVEALQ